MNTKRSQLIIKTLTVLLVFGLSGCGATVFEAGHCAYNHIRGDLLGIVPYQVEQVFPAAANVIKELEGYDLAEQQSDFLNAHIIAYDKQSRKVQIDLSRTEENQTKIQIRIGAMGDKLESSMIFNYVVNKLSKEEPLNGPYSKKSKG
ncbi:MAG: DUF3568 family protein [Phycisphaerae bacterium]|nr:DUF3568 family protein [Phycisphaerae bacterium]